MDKYEYQLKLDQLKNLVAVKDYETAAEIANTINWRKVRNSKTLMMVAEVYEELGQYEPCKEVLLQAYDHSSIGRNIVSRLAEVAIKAKNVTEAEEFYSEFLEIAPRDNQRYVLAYKISCLKDAPLTDRIAILEEFKEKEYTEMWAYELAALYGQAGMREKCVETCDELILWFGEGEFVEKALDLKRGFQPLTPAQEKKYQSFRAQKGMVEISVPKKVEAKISEDSGLPEITVTASKFNTQNLQDELAKSMKQIMEATEKETVSDTMDNIKKIVNDIPYLQSDAQEEAPVFDREKINEEVDEGLRLDFQELLEEEQDGQFSIQLPEDTAREQQVAGQMSIEEVLAEWEKTKRAAEAAIAAAEQKKLDMAKEQALSEASEIMERLKALFPVLSATPGEDIPEKPETIAETLIPTAEEKAAAEAAVAVKASEEPTGACESEVAGNEAVDNEKTPDLTDEGGEEPEEASETEPIEAGETVESEAAAEPDTKLEESESIGHVEPSNETESVEAAETDMPKEAETPEATEADASEAVEAGEPEETEVSETAEADVAKEPEVLEAVEAGEPKLTEPREVAEADEPKEMETSEAVEADEPEKPEVSEASEASELEETEVSEASEAGEPEMAEVSEETVTSETEKMPDLSHNNQLPDTTKGQKVTFEEPEEDAQLQKILAAATQAMLDNSDVEIPVSGGGATGKVPFVTSTEPAEEPETAKQELSEAGESMSDTEDSHTDAATSVGGQQPPESEEAVMPDDSALENMVDDDAFWDEPDEEEPVTEERFEDAPQEDGILTQEEREMFSYFLPVPGVEEQILAILESAPRDIGHSITSLRGNFIVQGEEGSGKTVLATSLIKVIQRIVGKEDAKIGKISAEALNKKDFAALIPKLQGGFLIVDKAGNLTAETAARMSYVMGQNTQGLVVILEDDSAGIKRALSLDFSFTKKFTGKVKIPIFTIDELVDFGKSYANEMECVIEEMGVLAMYNRINNIQKLDRATTLAEVKDIVDQAIEKAESGGLKKLFAKKYDENDYLILREKDFE